MDLSHDLSIFCGREPAGSGCYQCLSKLPSVAETQVTVRLRYEAKTAVITIGDDGDGISVEDLPHIFERFYKGRNGKFGLGLAIAARAVEVLGGSITAQNGDHGAVFTLRLPGEQSNSSPFKRPESD
jgi:signal transduction histidine kinase